MGRAVQRATKRKTKGAGRIERDAVVRMALKLLDEDGIEAVSTRRLADKLGIAGPSLYWHFKNKRELLDHMAEAMLTDALPSSDPMMLPLPWREWLTISARSIRRAMTSHRDGAAVIASSRPTGKHPTLDRPAMVKRLQSEGFSEGEANYVLQSLMRYVLGSAIAEQSAMEREGIRVPDSVFEFGLKAIVEGFEAKHTRPRSRRR